MGVNEIDLRNLAFSIDFNDKLSSPIKKANESVDKVKKSMTGVATESVATGKAIERSMTTRPMDKMKQSLGTIKTGLKDVGKTLAKTGKVMTATLTLPIVAFGTKALHTVMGFDDAMANVQKISGATGKDLDRLREKAKELGATTAYSASEASDGMGILAASGMEVNSILATSEDMFNLMSAGSVTAETSASILTNTMAQFKLEAADSGYIVDTFAATSAKAKVSVNDLEHSMAMAGGTLASMNMDVAQSTAALGHLANAGTPVAQIGTIVNAMGREVKANADKFKKIGIEVYDPVTGKLKDMGSVMAEVEQAVKGKTDAERDSILSTVFSGQAMKGATDWLSQGSAAYDELTNSIINEDNAAKKMADTQEDTIGGAFRGMKSAIEGFMIEIGDVIKGPIQTAAKFVGELAGKFGELDEPTKKMIITIAAVVAAIGPLIFVIGKVMGVMSLLMSPIGLVVIAITAFVGVLIYAYNHSEKFRDIVNRVWESVKTNAKQTVEDIKLAWQTLVKIFDVVSGAVKKSVETIKENWESLKKFLKNPIKGTVELAQSGMSKLKERFSHASGAYNIPYDNYPANLHKEEMVLTAGLAKKFRSLGGTEDSMPSEGFTNETTTIDRSVNSQGTGGIIFSPTYNIELSGTATKEDKEDIKKVIDGETRRLFDVFFREMNMRMA